MFWNAYRKKKIADEDQYTKDVIRDMQMRILDMEQREYLASGTIRDLCNTVARYEGVLVQHEKNMYILNSMLTVIRDACIEHKLIVPVAETDLEEGRTLN